MTKLLALLTAALLASAMVCAPSEAKFANLWQPVPFERLFKNVGEFVAANPKDARGHYTLGRLHSLAFAQGAKPPRVSGNPNDAAQLPGFPSYDSVLTPRDAATAPSTETLRHLGDSVREYRRATELAPKESLYWLGLGWMLEQGHPFADRVDLRFPRQQRKATAAEWRSQALAAYRKAYALDEKRDLTEGHRGPGADSLISLEAGEGIVRLLGERNPSPDAQAEVTRVQATIHTLKQAPRAITPIIFPLGRPMPLEELVDPARVVTFDLAGDTQSERWPWLKPAAGVLVWDPQATGRITSGVQLFGSFTWSMFWQNGYEPLAALDNDHDGWLSGRELKGIAVWWDRNGNGTSEPGEVRPVAAYQVMRIAVRPDGTPARVPSHARGIERRDGTFLPTYDWTPTSLPRADQ